MVQEKRANCYNEDQYILQLAVRDVIPYLCDYIYKGMASESCGSETLFSRKAQKR
jgi:hypothetical protein